MARRFATPIPCELTTTGTGVLARFADPVRIDHLELRENLAGASTSRTTNWSSTDG